MPEGYNKGIKEKENVNGGKVNITFLFGN